MMLWVTWWLWVRQLAPAFHRRRTFLWFALALAGLCIRTDRQGVTSLVRALGLVPKCYDRLLDMFHSFAMDRELLTQRWSDLVSRVLEPFLYRVNGRVVLLADGIKAPKTGRKMPAVKKLHQESENNTKPAYIFGHSCQAVALVAKVRQQFLAVPLACRIHEGLVFSNRDQRTLLDKLILLVRALGLRLPYILVADAYYASAKIILPLLDDGQHLVTAVRNNAVAYQPLVPTAARGRGRPRLYGKKIALRTFFDEPSAFTQAESPVYGEKGVTLSYRVLDLVWRPVGRTVRFVLVMHPTRGRRILLCTDLSLSALQVIELFGVRFKIEVSFKQAIYTTGTYAYHFWMAGMKTRSRRSGDQYLHRQSRSYRDQVRRKINAYHAHIQLGVIAQGLLQMLSICHANAVWEHFGSWFRTFRPHVPPSELVVAYALRHALPLFLAVSSDDHPLAKFIRLHIDRDRAEGVRLAS